MLGERIGRYEVVNHLASGGMGQVYLARSTSIGGFERHVVVKTLEVSDDDDPFVTMFLDEAKLVGALHHQYIAPVFEVGFDDERRYYLVMDYIHGETAEAVWKRGRELGTTIPLPFSLTVVAAIASALDYTHSLCASDGSSLEIVHRDVSLSNVMIGYDGAVKLIDFGIAKSANRSTRTRVGTLKGKLGYLAPEQVLRKPIDHRADIFALGIVLYELTTMTRAFAGDSELLTLERITKGEITPPSQIDPDYPRSLELIVMKALAVDPELRYCDAASMLREVRSVADRLGAQLGDVPLVATMRRLFDDPRPGPGGRHRLARASEEISKVDLIVDPMVEADAEPTSPIDELELIMALPLEDEETTAPMALIES